MVKKLQLFELKKGKHIDSTPRTVVLEDILYALELLQIQEIYSLYEKYGTVGSAGSYFDFTVPSDSSITSLYYYCNVHNIWVMPLRSLNKAQSR
ncbi:MAG: hypothetical protein CM15mP83_7000 [Flavobacteriaceae bacterium]|nr:MAG: hypothetical protein CM15mP83_7000 [Flavobacteriaceae bacterium]